MFLVSWCLNKQLNYVLRAKCLLYKCMFGWTVSFDKITYQGDAVILLRLRLQCKIMLTHRDPDNLTANPIMQ